MAEADGWYMCRVGFVETFRAVGLAAGVSATRGLKREWPAFGIVEVDQSLVERAAALAVERDVRTLDALHLAAALLLPGEDVIVATWDRRLHAAAEAEGLALLPASLA
jgi:predicted nucleic acid-binding protein